MDFLGSQCDTHLCREAFHFIFFQNKTETLGTPHLFLQNSLVVVNFHVVIFQLTKKENLQQAQMSDLQLNPSAATVRHFIDRCEQPCNKSNLPHGQTASQEPCLLIQLSNYFTKYSASNPLQVSLLFNADLIFHYCKRVQYFLNQTLFHF